MGLDSQTKQNKTKKIGLYNSVGLAALHLGWAPPTAALQSQSARVSSEPLKRCTAAGRPVSDAPHHSISWSIFTAPDTDQTRVRLNS